MLAQVNLTIIYSKIFALCQHHKYSIHEIEDIFPFERDIYFEMLVRFLREKEEMAAQATQA